jgi:1-deoxy-D-xylulose 5-phosphate reductoisomerase
MKEHIENALLRAIGKSSPKRRIDKFNPAKYNWKKLGKNYLPGIETVLKHFKKSPQRMRGFLEKEEEVINKFLNGKIKFTEIYKLLK